MCAELLDDVATSFSGQAQVAGVDLRVDGGGDDGGRLDCRAGDYDRLDQVLGNLVGQCHPPHPCGGQVTLRAMPRLRRRRAHPGERYRRGHCRRRICPTSSTASGAATAHARTARRRQRAGPGHRPPAGAGPRRADRRGEQPGRRARRLRLTCRRSRRADGNRPRMTDRGEYSRRCSSQPHGAPHPTTRAIGGDHGFTNDKIFPIDNTVSYIV